MTQKDRGEPPAIDPGRPISTSNQTRATPQYMQCGAAMSSDSMERFLATFERSTRRWEIVVYPALFAFMVLAAYGFFLVYNLTYDMRVMSQAIDPDMGQHMRMLADSTQQLAGNIAVMTSTVQGMSEDLTRISRKMDDLKHMDPIRIHMKRMDDSMKNMVITTDRMHQDMAMMSANISRPMSTLNKIMPW